MFRAKHAFTLVELMVALVLGGLVLGVIAFLLLSAMRTSVGGTARVELQQAAAVSAERLARDLQKAPVAALTLTSRPDLLLLTIHPLAGVGLDGQQQWSNILLLYRWQQNEGKLEVREIDVGAHDAALRPNSAQIQGWLNDGNITPRTLASEVTLVELSSADPTIMKQPLHLVIDLERRTGGGKEPESYHLERDLFLMNSSL